MVTKRNFFRLFSPSVVGNRIGIFVRKKLSKGKITEKSFVAIRYFGGDIRIYVNAYNSIYRKLYAIES